MKAQLKVRKEKSDTETLHIMSSVFRVGFYLNAFPSLLQLVTHERDMLKKDVKKITMERDGALKHLSLTTGITKVHIESAGTLHIVQKSITL